MKSNTSRLLAHAVTAAAVAAAFGLTAHAAAASPVYCESQSAEKIQADLVLLSKQASGIRARAEAEQRDLTDEEHEDLDQIFAAFEAAEARLSMAQQQDNHQTRAQIDAQASTRSAGRKAEPNRLSNALRHDAQPVGLERMGVILNRASAPSIQIFGKVRGGDGGQWKSADEFFSVLKSGIADPRLFSNATNTEGVGVDGGFIVPEHWLMGVMDGMMMGSQFAQRCRVFGTPTNDINIPMLDTSNRQAGTANLSARWSAEGSQLTAQKLKFRLVKAKLKKMGILVQATNELVEDGVGYAAQLQVAFGEEGALTLDESIMLGTGVGQPLGVLNSGSVIEISPESGQSADTIVYQNLVNMYTRVHPKCQKSGIWVYTPNALPQLLTMTIPGTDGHPVLLSGGPNDAASGAPAQTIFGRPAISSELLPQLGDRGDFSFIDFSQYALLMKASASIAFDPYSKFEFDTSQWRMTKRADGLPMWDQAVTPRNGGPTLSWAVTLGARGG